MQILRKIFSITWKDTRLRFSSPMEWLFFLILPLVFTVILAGGTGSSGDSRPRLVVVDQAQTGLSGQLAALLGESQSAQVEPLPLAEAEAEFEDRNAVALLVIPAGFDLPALEKGRSELELHSQPNNLNALAADQAVQAAIRRLGSEFEIASLSTDEAERIRPFPSPADRQAYFDRALQAAHGELSAAPERIAVTQAATQDSTAYDPRANSSAGQLITWVFIPLLGISGMFAYERQSGALRRLLTTPTQRGVYLLGTITGQVLLALVQMLLLVGFGALVMKVSWGQSPAALALILVASALAAAALGAALGAFVKTDGQAQGLSILLGMVMALLGGCWYPLELFPGAVRTAALVLPTRWAMQGMLDIVLRGQGLAAVLPEAGVLLGFAVVFFTVGVLRFRFE